MRTVKALCLLTFSGYLSLYFLTACKFGDQILIEVDDQPKQKDVASGAYETFEQTFTFDDSEKALKTLSTGDSFEFFLCDSPEQEVFSCGEVFAGKRFQVSTFEDELYLALARYEEANTKGWLGGAVTNIVETVLPWTKKDPYLADDARIPDFEESKNLGDYLTTLRFLRILQQYGPGGTELN